MTKRYGLNEGLALIRRRPGLTTEDLELIRVFAEECLGYKNVVRAEAEEFITLLEAKVQKERVAVEQMREAIRESEARVASKLGLIDQAEELKRLFGN